MNDKVIDLTATSTPRIVPPATVTYNSYSLSMSFFENRDENDVSVSNESVHRSLPRNQFPRSMRLVLLYLRGEQDKFRGIAEARGAHWKTPGVPQFVPLSTTTMCMGKLLTGGECWTLTSLVLGRRSMEGSKSSWSLSVKVEKDMCWEVA